MHRAYRDRGGVLRAGPDARSLRPLALLLLALALLLGGLIARAQPQSRHLALGNPSGAVADPSQPANYLISRDQYALSYHRDRGIPNWVSRHLESGDLGDTPRYSGPFIPDISLPAGWYRVRHDDYTNSGYDRGHMVPSADRTVSTVDNEATFILTNIVPQTPEHNQGLWAELEEHARDLIAQGNELYMLVKGKLVLKLPRQRVDALIAAGAGERFDPGHGRPMKEWVALEPTAAEVEWLPLAREALSFVSDQAR